MSPFYPMENGIQVEVIHLLFGRPCECVFTFQPRPVVVGPSFESAALAVFQYWQGRILPRLSDELYFTRVRVLDISTVGGQQLLIDFPEPYRGGQATPSLSANVAVRVNLRVVNPPGGARGCYFIPGVPSNQVSGNTLAREWLAELNDHVSDLIDLASLQGWRWVVPHTVFPGRGRPPFRIGWRVDFVLVESPWTGQRRSRLHNVVLP